jgi:hypothetical protein
MKTTLCTLTMLMLTTTAQAEVPDGPDAINGAFGRMLAHPPAELTDAGPVTSVAGDVEFERWVNAAARGEMSSLEAGFAHMLSRRDDVPRSVAAQGEPDAVALMVAEYLRQQQQQQSIERVATR